MNKIKAVIVGFLYLAATGAYSQPSISPLGETYQKASSAAAQTRETLAASKAQAATINPADALNAAKVGVAAKFISIKPGKFKMGSPADEADRWPDEIQHPVELTKGFEMQATAVTQLQYFLITNRNPSNFKNEENCDEGNFKVVPGPYGRGICVNHPVENVTWFEAIEFANKLSELQDFKPAYVIERNADGSIKDAKANGPNIYDTEGYRLPTESEWEYAARAGTPSDFPYSFGFNDTNELDNYGWFNRNSGNRTHAVATKKANPWGLYDMHGNVYEWVQDFYEVEYGSTVTNPTGPTSGKHLVQRGGYWGDSAGHLRSSYRRFGGPVLHSMLVGFRLVRSSR